MKGVHCYTYVQLGGGTCYHKMQQDTWSSSLNVFQSPLLIFSSWVVLLFFYRTVNPASESNTVSPAVQSLYLRTLTHLASTARVLGLTCTQAHSFDESLTCFFHTGSKCSWPESNSVYSYGDLKQCSATDSRGRYSSTEHTETPALCWFLLQQVFWGVFSVWMGFFFNAEDWQKYTLATVRLSLVPVALL